MKLNKNFITRDSKDSVVVKNLLSALEASKSVPGSTEHKISVNYAGQTIQATDVNSEDLARVIEQSEKHPGFFILQASVHLTLNRAGNQGQQSRVIVTIAFSRKDNEANCFADVKLISNEPIPDPISTAPFLHQVVLAFDIIEPDSDPLLFSDYQPIDRLNAMEQQHVRFTTTALNAMEEVSRRLTEDSLSYSKKLKRERAELEDEFRSKEESLKQKVQELKEKEQSLDLADAKTSRRKIRGELREKLEDWLKDFNFTRSTSTDRGALLLVILLGIIFSGYILFETSTSINTILNGTTAGGTPSPSSLNFLLYFKLAASSVFFSGLVVYLIRWQSNWVKQRTQEEIRLVNTSIDVERASWVLESLLELKGEGLNEMPPVLLEAVTRGLFEKNDATKGARVENNEILTLLKAGKSIELDVYGNKVILDKSGLRKIAREHEGAQ